MVRTKEKPSHINSTNNHKKVSWNLQHLRTNHSDSIPGSSSEGETPLIDLINDDDEEDEDDDDYDDYDDDFDYKPPPSYQRNVIQDSFEVQRVEKVKKTKKKEQKIEYGLFKNVLEKCDFCVRIDSELSNLSNIHCLFGEISIEIIDFSDKDLNIGDSFWLYVSKESNQSAIYFEWNEEDISSPSSKKSKKLKANNFKYFHVSEVLDSDLWSGINVQRYFQIVVDKVENNLLFLKIYFLKTGLVNLNYSCEFNQGNKTFSAVCSHFYGIQPFEKDGEVNYKHDIDIFYKAIKNAHQGIEYSTVDTQHPNLIPQLRPYQNQAVKWMLHQERVQEDSMNQSKLHPLYVEITSLDNKLLYYNRFGRFFVSSKPLEVASCPGGILADEMGLGKTVEVLACIMYHFREDVPKHSYQKEVSEGQKDISLKSKSEAHKNVYSAKETKNTELMKDQSCSSVCMDDENELALKLEPDDPDIGENGNFNKENEYQMTETKGRHAKRKASSRISYSLLDSILDSDKEDIDYEPEFCPSDSSENYNTDKENKSIQIEKKGQHYKRKASQINCSYLDPEEEEKMEYEPDSKKRKFKHSSSPKKFDVDTEIAENSILSTIEKVILEKSWDGILKNYKKEGSHKEFRKFLKKRKKDPCYMMTLREKLTFQYLSNMAEYSATGALNRSVCQGFFDTKVKQKSYFECVCGKEENTDSDEMFRVQCTVCSLWQHADCVQFKLHDPDRGDYICPHCWTTQAPVVSGATLIVAPSSISHQWVEEIRKHIKEKSLKVFVYNGVSSHGYIQPRSLACYDIVITTYETLRREVNYVDLPHSNSEAGRRFRFPKRFMATPSPLPCVEWWRVCLDEAQMVECITTKTAEMALRLSAINRWCITGTPIQKTVNDLQGLLMFLGVDPYFVPQWWRRCLYDPYCYGDAEPLHTVMAKYMWRNSKQDVVHELDIPPQNEEIHWLNFTPVEEHFYKRLHADCSSEALRRIRKFSDRAIKLSSLDRQTLSSLLQPLLKLRHACDHPQVVKGHFIGLNRKTLTMEQLLENLLKKTQLEVEDAQRVIVASLNGLAAIDIIRENFANAVDKYREVLRSVEEHKENFKTDSLQQLHTLHNLAEIIQAKHEGIYPTLRDETLAEEAKGIRARYLKHYPQRIAEVEYECNQNYLAVEEQKSKFHYKSEWWISALESLAQEFVQEVREELLSQYTRFEEHKCILYPIQTRVQLLQLLKVKMKMLENQRKNMLTNIRELLKLDPANVVNGAIDCHLRPSDVETLPCILCLKHEYFEDYEQNLFFVKETKHSRSTDRSKETKEMKAKLQLLEATRQGNWGQSETERVLRYLQTKSLGRVESHVHEDSQTHLLVLQAMKKEFKNFRILWRAVYDHVSALDEVNMATLRFRLRFPGEELPSAKKKKTEPAGELEKKMDAPKYILEESELSQQEMKLKCDKVVGQNELRVKLGQFFYLKNLKKVDFGKEGNGNPEPCPVCQGKLEYKWKVLLCGHSYCLDCASILIKAVPTCTVNGSIKCPMCRQPTKVKEIAYVDIRSTEENESIKVIGSLSTKIGGVVRTMLKIKASDPEAKVLIFSSWNEVLEVIADGLAQNGVTYRMLQSNKKFQLNLSSFKSKQEITALLMPISSGANGLNLVEARHIIMVEPILNPGAEVQAIGRIHRIGQNKATIVHRFLIHSTIEERMYNIIHPKYLEKTTEENSLLIEDLYQLFALGDNDGGK